jgi:hypothetical protein
MGIVQADGEAPGPIAADEATEHRLRVEARDAQPIDGSLAGAQGGGSAVSNDPVVTDGTLGHGGEDTEATRGE